MLPLQSFFKALKNALRWMSNANIDTKIFRLSIGIILLMFFSFQSYGQTDPWILSAELEGVKIYVKNETCQEKNVYLLKVENTTSNQLNIEWDEKVSLDGDSISHQVNPSKKVMEIAPGITEATSCEDLISPLLLSFPAAMLKPGQADHIEAFFIENLSVK